MFNKLKENINSAISLSESEWSMLEEKFTLRKILKNEFFIREGNSFNFEAFVAKGCFQVYHINDKANKHAIAV